MNYADIKAMLDLYLDAEKRILKGQEVVFQGRRLTLADLEDIQKGRREWEQKLTNAGDAPEESQSVRRGCATVYFR